MDFEYWIELVNKVVNIIATTKNEIKLLLVSFFKNDGNYHYSKVEILS